MKLLLDTHALLWAATSPASLSAEARDLIEDGANEVFVSVVTAWEIALKQSLGKLQLAKPAEVWLPEVLRRSGFEVLPVEMPAALRVRSLPWHHRDPFDRLLVAQSLEGGFRFVTRDPALRTYGVDLVSA